MPYVSRNFLRFFYFKRYEIYFVNYLRTRNLSDKYFSTFHSIRNTFVFYFRRKRNVLETMATNEKHSNNFSTVSIILVCQSSNVNNRKS